jgi:hypothetical protein
VVGTVDVVHGRTLGQGGANAGGSGHLLGLRAPVELVAWPAAPPVWLSSLGVAVAVAATSLSRWRSYTRAATCMCGSRRDSVRRAGDLFSWFQAFAAGEGEERRDSRGGSEGEDRTCDRWSW